MDSSSLFKFVPLPSVVFSYCQIVAFSCLFFFFLVFVICFEILSPHLHSIFFPLISSNFRSSFPFVSVIIFFSQHFPQSIGFIKNFFFPFFPHPWYASCFFLNNFPFYYYYYRACFYDSPLVEISDIIF